MNNRNPSGRPEPVSSEDGAHEECEPTTQIEIHINHDQDELRSLIENFDEEEAASIADPEETIIDDATDLREKISKESAPVISDFVGHQNSSNFYNYSSSPDFSPQNEQLPHNCYRHYTELMAMVRSYEKMLGDDHNLGISLQHYPELKLIRLLSISVFGSGSVILLGMGDNNMPINIFEKIDQLSLAVVPMKRDKSKAPRTEVSFFFHDQSE